MKWKMGTAYQIIYGIIIITLVIGATQYNVLSNIHLVYTIFLTILYLIYMSIHSAIRPSTVSNNASYIFIIAWVTNAIVSYGSGWWFSGIAWTFNCIAYIYVVSSFKENQIM